MRSQPKTELNLFHSVFIGLFILALIIRIYGASVINISNSEAEILLSITDIKSSDLSSFLYDLILKALLFIGIKGTLGLRLINAVAGSIIVFLPMLFYKETGKKTAILASVFFAFDPFSIANSIVFTGSAITIVFAGLFLESFVHKRDYFFLSILILLLGHGRGLGYFLTISFYVLMILIILDYRGVLNHIKLLIKGITFNNKYLLIAGLLIFITIILSVVAGSPISNTTSDLVIFTLGLGKNFQIGNYPIVYPFALFSYVPLAIIASLIFLIKKPTKEIKTNKLIYLWTLLAFSVIAFYPRHQIIDLVWVSLPLWFITAKLVSNYLPEKSFSLKANLPFFAVLLATGLNSVLNVITLVYRAAWGMGINNVLLASLLILIFIIILLLYRAYTVSISNTISIFFLVIFIYIGLLQLSISARTIGTTHRAENEILWNGYFEDQDIVKKIITTTKTSVYGTSGNLNIMIDGQITPSILWALNNGSSFYQKSFTLDTNPEVIVSTKGTISLVNGSYRGEEFISNSYPIWTWDPVVSFISTDFWNWFFFRNNQQYKEYNSIWINKTVLEEHSLIGVK